MKDHISHFRFNRNGVAGNGFYSLVLTYGRDRLLVTFETKDDDQDIDVASMRAVSIDNPSEHYRAEDATKSLTESFRRWQLDNPDKIICDFMESFQQPEAAP